MTMFVIATVIVLTFVATLLGLAACMLSSKISQEEERRAMDERQPSDCCKTD